MILSSADLTGFAFLDGPRNYSPIVSDVRWQQKVGVEWRSDYDPLRKRIVNSSLTADMHFTDVFFVSAGHTQVNANSLLNANQVPILSPETNMLSTLVGFGKENRRGWNAAFSAYYDYKAAVMRFATTNVAYNTDCCGISVQYRRFAFGSRNENQFRVAFAVANIGSFGTLKRQEKMF